MTDTRSTAPSLAQAKARLARLNGYLQSDPTNAELLADVFASALFCNEWELANSCLQAGRSNHPQDLGWLLREGELLLARGLLEPAREFFSQLRERADLPGNFLDVVAHNLAFVEFQSGNFQACLDILSPYANGPAATGKAAVWQAIQALWLQALHHRYELDKALEWARRLDAQGSLGLQARAIAALIAVDADDLDCARAWAAVATQSAADCPAQGWVAAASVSLRDRQAQSAIDFAAKALELKPNDGRAWSAMAFGHMLNQNLQEAGKAFRTALEAMPGHIGTWHGYAWTMMLLSESDAAAQGFESALELDRNFADTHGGLAVVKVQQGLPEQARECAARALRLDPDNIPAQYATALLAGRIRDAADLRGFVEKILG